MKHVAVLLVALSAAGGQPQAARNLNERGVAAYSHGDYAAAERFYREAIAEWQELGDGYSAHMAITKMNLGNALTAEGRRAEAAPELEESLALFRRSLGLRDGRALDCMNTLGGLEIMRGNYERADSLLSEALRAERELRSADVTRAQTLSETAILRLRQGRTAEALATAEESLALATKAGGEESVEAALAYSAVAEAHETAGNSERALPLYRRARAIYQKRLGPNHPRIASVMGRIAMILAAEGALATAAAEIRRALAMLDKSCLGCAYERRMLDLELAHVSLSQGERAEAEVLR